MRKEIPKRQVVLQTRENKAIILAAGLGTRLKPLTDHRPKALVEWEGVPLLDHAVLKLREAGFSEIIINVHHMAEMIMDHVEQRDHYGIRIAFSHEKDELLDTGGGIANAAWFFDDRPFLVYNVDIKSSINLNALMEAHLESGAIATMAVKERVTSRSLLMDEASYLKGWRDNRTGEEILLEGDSKNLIPIAFSAIHVMDPGIFELFPAGKRFPIMPFYLELARSKPVFLYRHDRDEWMDLGKLESYSNS